MLWLCDEVVGGRIKRLDGLETVRKDVLVEISIVKNFLEILPRVNNYLDQNQGNRLNVLKTRLKSRIFTQRFDCESAWKDAK